MKVSLLLALVACVPGFAQEVYKWTDERDIVHYSDSAPAGDMRYELITLAPSQGITFAKLPPPVAKRIEVPAENPVADALSAPIIAAVPAPASSYSLAELDSFCDEARERVIAPLRSTAVAECKVTHRRNPEYCERFYADFGDAGITAAGMVRPRAFDDLPECGVARQERTDRSR
jgi:hypothetical protein